MEPLHRDGASSGTCEGGGLPGDDALERLGREPEAEEEAEAPIPADGSGRGVTEVCRSWSVAHTQRRVRAGFQARGDPGSRTRLTRWSAVVAALRLIESRSAG